jgi:pimeloyl-ACP methyl ester carboxylesterase
MNEPNTGWTERAVVRDGVRLVARDQGGPGRPVLFLHGLAGYGGEWDATVAGMRGRYRAVTLDQRGHGASERRPRGGDMSRSAYVADVVEVITALGLDDVVLVGQSLGGNTAMLVAAARPDLVRSLVMVEAGARGLVAREMDRIGAWLDSWPVPFGSLDAAADFFSGGPAGAGWAAGLERRDDGWWPRFDAGLMVRSLAGLVRPSFWREWRQVSCPTLVVLGESGIIPLDEQREMMSARPGTVMVAVPGAGHDVHLDAPAALRAVLTDFLERHA